MTALGAAGANIAALLQRASARRGSAPAIVASDGHVTWRFDDLVAEAARLAGGLADLGIGQGDRVLILEPDRRRLHVIVVGVIWAGATAVFPPLSLPLPVALRVAASQRPRAVIASLPLWPAVLAVAGLRDAPIRMTSGRWRLPGTWSTGSLAHHAAINPQPVPAVAPAIISFTTGTTGPVRAILRSHGVLAAQHDAMSALRSLDDSDRDFTSLPVMILHDLGLGVTGVPAPRAPGSRSYGRRVRAAILRADATAAAGFPHLFESALRGARPAELGRIRSVLVGGSRVRPELLTGLQAIAPGAEVTVVYGSTEVEPIAAIGAGEYVARLADADGATGVCVGAVVAGLEVRLDGDAGGGRIRVRGARASAPPGADGWVDTGDLGRLDADGRLWLLGRAANAVGHTNPIDIEGVVEALPWVARAAFVAIDSKTGPRGRLAVQPRDWQDPTHRAEWQLEIETIAAERGWPVHDVLLVRMLPVLPGAAAKVDDVRLRRLRRA